MEEIWKDIKNYEGVYQVSNLGNIRSLSRNIIQGHFSENKYFRSVRYRIIKPAINRCGYKTVSLCYNGKKKTKSIHRIVAEAFIPNLNKLPVINHIDGDKTNNKVENLEWCTYKHNTMEAIRLGNFYFVEKKKI